MTLPCAYWGTAICKRMREEAQEAGAAGAGAKESAPTTRTNGTVEASEVNVQLPLGTLGSDPGSISAG